MVHSGDQTYKINQTHTLRRKHRAHSAINNATKLSDVEAHLQSVMSTAKVSYENKPVNNFTTSTEQ